jgi:catechol 2,3-dioxygenase-like lactoylglutathione lyase family enzyme
MPLTQLAHYTVRTRNLPASLAFYVGVLGLREGSRPAFDFPGHWLYLGTDESSFGVVHLVGIDDKSPQGLETYLGKRALEGRSETGALDHVAFFATGRVAWLDGLKRQSTPYRERVVPEMGLHQVFLEDPDGVTIELNFPASE